MIKIWKRVGESNVEVCEDGRCRRKGVEFVPGVDSGGYRQVRIGKKVSLHRLIAGQFIPNPEMKRCVDHVDGDILNNAVSNLRWATHTENGRNRGLYTKASSLPRGVYAHGKKFKAMIRYEGKNHYLGVYETIEEASDVYEVTAEELFGEFFRPLG